MNKKSAHMVGQRSKVSAIRPPANEIEPHEGWVLHSNFGYMGRDSTPAGRLVRLVDLEWWLSERRGIPRAEASRLIADVMRDRPEAIERSLFLLQPGDYAQPLRPSRQELVKHQEPAIGIKLLTADEAESLRVVGVDDSTSVNLEIAVQRFEEESQRSAKEREAEREAQEATDRIASLAPSPVPRVNQMDHRAILMTVAHELWGYGRAEAQPAVAAVTAGNASTPKDSTPDVSTWAGLVKFVLNTTRFKWNGAMFQTLLKEEARRKDAPDANEVRKSMGDELDISEARIGQLLRRAPGVIEKERKERLMAAGTPFKKG